MPVASVDLCAADDLRAIPAREFAVGEGAWPLRVLVVRVGEDVHGFVNRCPHAGHPLNLRPDDFLSPDGRLLVCRSHGAMFDPASGVCIAGPCPGTRLERVPLELADGRVRLAAHR
jgi:nitrite reductase/ring-hydroxylating ferredoxin subunit